MRNPLSILYYCDAENCMQKTRVWEEDGKWVGYDLKSNRVFLRECGLPLPPTWVTVGDKHFCPNHNISVDRNAPTKLAGHDDVKITITGGLYEPVREEKR